MPTPADLSQIAVIGIGATVLLDAWQWLLRCLLGVPSSNWALVGRWVGHMARGRFVHAAIAKAAPVRAEAALGWAVHYAVGVSFAALLVALQGLAWFRQPTWGPALAFGVATVVLPLGVMQPAMGAGFAALRTAAPLANGVRSLVNHAVFGAGLYLAASVLAITAPR